MTDGGFWPVRTRPEKKKKIGFFLTMEGRGGPKWTHLTTTRKTRGELREHQAFADDQVRHEQWEKRWLWKGRVLGKTTVYTQ